MVAFFVVSLFQQQINFSFSSTPWTLYLFFLAWVLLTLIVRIKKNRYNDPRSLRDHFFFES